MIRHGLLATEALDEELNLVQHLNNETFLQEQGESEELRQDAQAIAETAEVSTSEDSDTPSSEEHEDSDTDPEVVTPDQERSTVAAESFRNTYYDRLVTESFDLSQIGHSVGQGTAAVAIFTYTQLKELAGLLFYLGVTYTPTLLRFLRKGVVYFFMRSVKLIKHMDQKTTEYRHRLDRTFSKNLKEIRNLKEAAQALQDAGANAVSEGRVCQDQKLIPWLITRQGRNTIQTAEVVHSFMRAVVSEIDTRIQHDVDQVKKLTAMGAKSFPGGLTQYLKVTSFTGGFQSKRIPGYAVDDHLLTSQVYPESLPDGTRFVAHLPKPGLADLEEYSKAYQHSRLFLTVNVENGSSQDRLDYMTTKQLIDFLDRLEQVALLGRTHQQFYIDVAKQAQALKLNFKDYWNRLTGSKDQVSLVESLGEYIYLKQAFVSGVYLPGAMAIHGFTGNYLTRAVRFTKENLKALKANVPEEPSE